MIVINLRLGVFGLLVHDVQDHAAGGWAALGGGVDADWFLSSTGVLFTVHVNPASTGKIGTVYKITHHQTFYDIQNVWRTQLMGGLHDSAISTYVSAAWNTSGSWFLTRRWHFSPGSAGGYSDKHLACTAASWSCNHPASLKQPATLNIEPSTLWLKWPHMLKDH